MLQCITHFLGSHMMLLAWLLVLLLLQGRLPASTQPRLELLLGPWRLPILCLRVLGKGVRWMHVLTVDRLQMVVFCVGMSPLQRTVTHDLAAQVSA